MRALVQVGLVLGLAASCVLGVGLFYLLALFGLLEPLAGAVALLALGWLSFLRRVGPLVEIDPAGVALAVACLLLLVGGLHLFVRGIATTSAWPWRRTCGLVGLFMLLFINGLSAVGLFRSASALVHDEPPLKRNARRGFTLIELLVIIAIIFILCGLLGVGPGEAVFYTLFGWVSFLWKLPTETSFDAENTFVFVVCLTLLAVGLHFTLRWWHWHRHAGSPPGSWPWRWTAATLSLFVLAAGAGVCAVAVAHQTTWLTRYDGLWYERTASARMASHNNMKQLALALHNYHDQHKHLPPGGTFGPHGEGLHGWQTFILPYVEEQKLFEQIDLTEPWDDPVNLPAMKRRINLYLYPTAPVPKNDEPAPSHYAGNVRVLGPTAWKLTQVADGTSNTLLLGEAAGNFRPWGHPANWRDPALGLNRSPDGFGRPGSKGVSFALADGSVRFFSEDVSPEVLRALSTPAGGENVEVEDVIR